MRKHRFFLNTILTPSTIIEIPAEIKHHITKVLRLKDGAEIYLFNNTGNEYLARLANTQLNIISLASSSDPSPLQIHLAQVIGKGDKMDWVIQKATELGVHTITPLFSEFSISSKTSKLPHWEKIAIAASSQCWRNDVPIINQPVSLQTWIKQTLPGDKFVLSMQGSPFKKFSISTAITILVGPEGGLSNVELDLALANNFKAVTLGPRILRTETAGLAAIAILQGIAGDM